MVWWHRKIHNTNVKKQFCDDSYELQKLETFFAVILFQVQQCECMTGALSLTLLSGKKKGFIVTAGQKTLVLLSLLLAATQGCLRAVFCG